MSIFRRHQFQGKYSFDFSEFGAVGTVCTISIKKRSVFLLWPGKWETTLLETVVCKGRNPFTGAEWYSVETGRRLPIQLELSINDAATEQQIRGRNANPIAT